MAANQNILFLYIYLYIKIYYETIIIIHYRKVKNN